MRKHVLYAAAAAMLLSVASPAFAATVVVKEADVTRQAENTPPTDNWVIYTRVGAATATFRSGPTGQPFGVGSLELSTPTGADKVTIFNYDHVGTLLADIDGMSYSAFRSAGALQQDAALNIQVDYNGAAPGGFTTLVFEPVYNTDQGAVVSGAWQFWDAYNGGDAIWWSSNPIPSAPNRDTFVTWDTIVAANPNAVILGGFGVNQGSGNGTLVTAVDGLSFSAGAGSVTYDFEPTIAPTDKEQCKKGGWQTFNSPTFKNQGDCVSYMAKNKN